MDAEEQYLEYGITLILTVLGVSASYLLDFSSPITFAALIFLPILYGHTASISTQGFNKASLVSLIALIFVFLGGLTAVISLIYSIGNILVSLFAEGNRFKDFYSSTSLPLIITGLVIGASIFGYSSLNNDFKQKNVLQASEEIGQISQQLTKNSSLIQDQKQNQLILINQTARSSVILTQQKVYNETQPSQEVIESLKRAETEIPQIIVKRSEERIADQNPQISDRVTELLEKLFNQNFILVIPLSIAALLSLQPLIGVLTALSAKTFSHVLAI